LNINKWRIYVPNLHLAGNIRNISVDLFQNQLIMENGEKGLRPIFSHVEPVLAVRDIRETITYWQDVLGFPTKWTWGDPPSHGGVSWQKVFIQFSRNPVLAAAPAGNAIWIRLQHIEALYSIHQKNNAEIVAPLEMQSYGMAQYTLRDNNGYFVHFAGHIADREKSAVKPPEAIQIIERKPTVQEFRHLQSATGEDTSATTEATPAVADASSTADWASSANDAILEAVLAAAVYAVVAEDTASGEVIGCALLPGDHATFYYVKDIMVHPNWQGKRVGTALMQALIHWLERNGADNALVGLFAQETLEPFYQQFGFAQAFAMLRYIRRDKGGEDRHFY
jgi:GNAT superfamily N-acetyltransferase/uncharacterized glyoxalase superfamily protein PhnB